MTLQTFLLSIILVVGHSTFGQKAEIDTFAQAVDSSVTNNKAIVLHTVRHQTDDTSVHYFDRYYIDTLRGVLVKSIYEFDFDGGEYLEFYYRDSEIIMVNAKHELNERKFAGTFYFKSGNLIAHTDGEITPGNIVFDLKQILKTGNRYVNDLAEIIKSFKNYSPR